MDIKSYLSSRKNMVGTALAGGGIGLHFVDVLVFDMWGLAVVGLYGVGALVVPNKKEMTIAEMQRQESDSLIKEMNDFFDSVMKDLSPDVQTQLKVLGKKTQRLIDMLDRLNGGSAEVHTIKRTVTTYLPDILRDYMELPVAYRRQHKMECGRTPKEEIIEQIRVLDKEMDGIIEKATNNKMNDLKIHGQFLTEKYEKRTDWFK